MALRELTVDAVPDPDPSFVAALSGLDRDEWTVFTRQPWVHIRPRPEPVGPRQGWKLHLSATPANAAAVLRHVAPVLAAHKVAFKVLATEALVAESTAPTAPRGGAGKFVTVYPPDDSSCRALAAALHAATEDLTGPAILSDKRYRPDSLVHYRYGGFQARLVVDDDGQIHHVLKAPNGDLWFDERNAWFSPPPWARDPFASPTSPSNPKGDSEGNGPGPRRTDRPRAPVLLAGRFLAKEALKHANGGGVYVAEDTRDGGLVVVKEARPSVGAASDGTDKRDLLEREAHLLRRAAPSGAVPVLVDEFDHSGHHFLVEQHLDGEPMRLYVRGMWANAPAGPSAGVALDVARAMVDALRAIHEAGVVVGDFTPNNLIVWPAHRRVAVVDLEIGQSDDLPPLRRRQLGTPGYATFDGRPSHAVTLADDWFGCGATLFFLVTGRDPAFVDMNAGAAVEHLERVRWLRALAPTCPAADALAPLIHGLTAPAEDERWSLDRAADWLDSRAARPLLSWEAPREREPAAPASVADDGQPEVRELFRSVVNDTVAAFADGMREGDWPWPVSSEFEDSDPANLQGGVSGVGLFMVACGQSLGDARALDVATDVGRRVRASFERQDLRGPSLYFGAAGALWFLLELGAATNDDELIAFALERTADLPRAVRNPDVCHGTAGLGLAALHAWLRCGDGSFLSAAIDAASALAERAAPHKDGYVWPIPDDTWSSMAGKTFFGFAHGVAGIAHFLLVAARAAGEVTMQQLALDAMRGLVSEAEWVGEEAYWLSGPDAEPYPEGHWPHWCNGSSGVGTALVRAYRLTDEECLRSAAYGAARAVVSHRWRWGVSQCHGTAGNAELLLDLEAWAPSPEAEDLTDAVLERLRASVRPWTGRRLLFDSPDRALVAGFNTGAAGAAALCLRWLTRGPRLLMLDDLLDATNDHRAGES